MAAAGLVASRALAGVVLIVALAVLVFVKVRVVVLLVVVVLGSIVVETFVVAERVDDAKDGVVEPGSVVSWQLDDVDVKLWSVVVVSVDVVSVDVVVEFEPGVNDRRAKGRNCLTQT